jgi:DNA-damage-inducible protein D
MTKEINQQRNNLFEQIRQTDENGNEFWSARDLSKALEYSEYRHFLPAIERAKEACINSGQKLTDHFEDILEMIGIGSCAQRKTIQELGGEMPENLLVADSIKKVEKAKQPKPLKAKKK